MKNFAKQSVVAHPKTGEVITNFDKNGKTYGTVRVDETFLAVENGYTSMKKRTAFITIGDDVLAFMSPLIKADAPYPLEGKIVVTESFEPFYEGQEAKMNPTTEEFIRVDGKLVYRNSDFTTDLNASDSLLRNSAPSNEVVSTDEEDLIS